SIQRTLTPNEPALPRTFTPSAPRIDVRSSHQNINSTSVGVLPARPSASLDPPNRPSAKLGTPPSFGHLAPATPTPATDAARKRSSVVTVLLVLVVAALAAVAVYFVLPLLM